MGFSTIGASVILFAALLFFSSTIANAWFEAQRDQDRMSEDQRDRYEFERRTSFDIYDGTRQGNTVRLYATNTGSTMLDTSRLQLLVNGQWQTDQINFLQIEGSAAYDLWAPGENLEVRFPSGGGGQVRAWLVSETGYADHWEG